MFTLGLLSIRSKLLLTLCVYSLVCAHTLFITNMNQIANRTAFGIFKFNITFNCLSVFLKMEEIEVCVNLSSRPVCIVLYVSQGRGHRGFKACVLYVMRYHTIAHKIELLYQNTFIFNR